MKGTITRGVLPKVFVLNVGLFLFHSLPSSKLVIINRITYYHHSLSHLLIIYKYTFIYTLCVYNLYVFNMHSYAMDMWA